MLRSRRLGIRLSLNQASLVKVFGLVVLVQVTGRICRYACNRPWFLPQIILAERKRNLLQSIALRSSNLHFQVNRIFLDSVAGR